MAAIRENEQSDLRSLRVKQAHLNKLVIETSLKKKYTSGIAEYSIKYRMPVTHELSK